jgi:hypothetical protein
MKPIERLPSAVAKTNHIWRFYTDPARLWIWERLAFDGTVIERSAKGYKEYEECMVNAREKGYVFLPSLSTKPENTSPKTKRSYVRLSTR